MQRLRSLIFLTVAVPGLALASPQLETFGISFRSQYLDGYLDPVAADTKQKISTIEQTLSSRWRLAEAFSGLLSLTSLKRDYSNIRLLQSNGRQIPLSESFNQPERLVTVGLSYSSGRHSFDLGLDSHISESPYHRISRKIEYSFRGPYDRYRLGSQLTNSHTDQPASYFIDGDLKTKERPTELVFLGVQIWSEAVLTEKWKVRAIFLKGERKQDRPGHQGAQVKTAYIQNSTLSHRFGIGEIKEENSPLKDERGRLSSRFLDYELSWNPSFRSEWQFSYGLVSEEEVEKPDGSGERTGHDILSTKFNYKLKRSSVHSALLFRETNSSVRELNFSGGITWEI